MPPKQTKEDDEMKKLQDSIHEVKNMLKAVQASQSESLKSQEYMSNSYDELLSRQNDILGQLKSMQQKVDRLTKASEAKDKEIHSLKQRVIQLENHSRRKNLEIHGVIEMPSENVEEIILNVARNLNVTLSHQDIECAHRVPTRVEGKPKPIIVELSSRKKREEIVSVKNKNIYNNDIIGGNAGGRIFVYAQVSPELKSLRWKAKQKANEAHWKFVWIREKFVWIRDGNLFAKQSESSRNSVKIMSEEDLAKIC